MTRSKYIVLSVILTAITHAQLPAQTGWGIGVIQGELYYSDLDRGQVVKLERNGQKRILLDDVHCHNLAPGFDGFLYGEAIGTNRGGAGGIVAVWQLSPQGELNHVTAPTTQPSEGIWIARDSVGNFYGWHREGERVSKILKHTDNRTVTVLAGGNWGFADGANEAARFSQVGGLAVSAQGTVYLTDNGSLRRITRDGSVTTVARDIVSPRTGGLPGDFGLFNHSQGVAVASLNGQENVFIVDHYNQRIVRWNDREGASTLHNSSNWLSRLTDGGLGWFIRGVAVDGNDVYVLEAFTSPRFLSALVGSPRIRRILPDGRVTSLGANDER